MPNVLAALAHDVSRKHGESVFLLCPKEFAGSSSFREPFKFRIESYQVTPDCFRSADPIIICFSGCPERVIQTAWFVTRLHLMRQRHRHCYSGCPKLVTQKAWLVSRLLICMWESAGPIKICFPG